MEDKLRRTYSKTYRNTYSRRKKYLIGVGIAAILLLIVVVEGNKLVADRRKNVGNLLLTALKPVGNTMYIWGGGWPDEEETEDADSVKIGVSPRWAEFAAKQDDTYDFETTRYQRHDGLDWSGYMGWGGYNIKDSRNGKESYVVKATCMALTYSKNGWGDFTEVEEVKEWRAGDIMSMKGHVWMVVGPCSDGSVVFLHSTPPGVSLAGTLLEDGSESEASKLAEEYIRTSYPDWYANYPEYGKDYTYLTTSASMSWNRETLSDEAGLTKMSAEEVLQWMFANREE